MDVKTHRYTGTSQITYSNNSPDTLRNIYFHLFNNAFQPGSAMDLRSLQIEDPDPRIGDRIGGLSPEEIGFLHITQLQADGKALKFIEEGTILEAELAKPLLPGKKLQLSLTFEAQSPLQIRRSGRDNKEGVAFSMAQWYPKVCEFDDRGWHADPYLEREFYGVWGDFDVTIHIDSAYTLGGTGVLVNPNEIGHGYTATDVKLKSTSGSKLHWHFKANKVHDFVWAADPDFLHTILQVENGPMLHFFRKNSPDLAENWDQLPDFMSKAMTFASANFGEYPWPQYSFIQGGDGGMEYPMATLITGRRKLGSLVGVCVHELMHTWYYGLLASNEGQYSWMDEGFASYAGEDVMDHLFPGRSSDDRPNYFNTYIDLARSGLEEPMATTADNFLTNDVYFSTTYSKGATFVAQLDYILGGKHLEIGLKKYFNEWKFKHPDPYDFIRVMEKQSDTHLKWYLNFMLNTTASIDYAIKKIDGDDRATRVALERLGRFPMPVDLAVTLQDSSIQYFTIPLDVMRHAKTEQGNVTFDVLPDWTIGTKYYELNLPIAVDQIISIVIDPFRGMADINELNNRVDLEGSKKVMFTN